MKRYGLWYDFVDTEEEAVELTARHNRNATRYIRKNKPAHYTRWSSQDGSENKFIVWSYQTYGIAR